MNDLIGIQHLVLSCRDAQRTVTFYTEVLGLALAESKTSASVVSFSSPATDRGCELFVSFVITKTHFPPLYHPRQISGVAFGIGPGRLQWWKSRLSRKGVPVSGWAWAFKEKYLCFTDPSDLELALTDDARAIAVSLPGKRAPAVGGVRLVEVIVGADVERVHELVERLGFHPSAQEGPVRRFEMDEPSDGVRLDLVGRAREKPSSSNAGGLRRLVLRVADAGALARLSASASDLGFGIASSDVRTVIDLTDQCGIDILLSANALQPGSSEALS